VNVSKDRGDGQMINEIEVLSDDGRWYLWNNQVHTAQLGNEVLRALQTYSKCRVNGGKVYSVD
jgi:hypothetical protein